MKYGIAILALILLLADCGWAEARCRHRGRRAGRRAGCAQAVAMPGCAGTMAQPMAEGTAPLPAMPAMAVGYTGDGCVGAGWTGYPAGNHQPGRRHQRR